MAVFKKISELEETTDRGYVIVTVNGVSKKFNLANLGLGTQFTVLPSASDNPGKVLQYIGETDSNYIQGEFYVSKLNGVGQYQWILVNSSSQSDWNENNTNAESFVKNRTHYTVDYESPELLTNQYVFDGDKVFELTEGVVYTVDIDGSIVNVTAISDGTGAIKLSTTNGNIWYWPNGHNYDGQIIYNMWAGNPEIHKFIIKDCFVQQLNEKFIPNTIARVSDIPDVSTKADKVANATAGNLAGLDASGNLFDSGKKSTDLTTGADWNIDGDTNVNGVKNRTHWREGEDEYEYEGLLTINDRGYSQEFNYILEEGKYYDVTINGVYYCDIICEYDEFEFAICLKIYGFNFIAYNESRETCTLDFSEWEDPETRNFNVSIKKQTNAVYHRLDDNFINETIQRVAPTINSDSVLVAGKRNHPTSENFTLPSSPGTAEYNGMFTASNNGDIATTGVIWKGDTTLKTGFTYEFSICEGIGWIAEVYGPATTGEEA